MEEGPQAQILCVVGARPNFMKIAPIMRAFKDPAYGIAATLLHTGQHYDAAMKHAFFEQLHIPEPDIDLGVGSGSHAQQTAEIMKKFEPVLDELKPSTTYYLTIVSGRQRSPEFRFVTAPADDRPLSIIFGGDSRTDIQGRRRVNRFLSELIHKNDDILAFAHGGDYVTNGDSLQQWSGWLSDHELTVTRDGRMIPIIPARGNHERGALQFDEVFDDPGGAGANYYVTLLSPQVLFITLNTEIQMDGDQRKFLDDRLLQTLTIRWQLAQYHRPAWPAFKRPSEAFHHWVPLFEQYRLDVVCEADGHVMKRTVPIRDQIQDPDGVVYVGEGGLGVTPRLPKVERWYVKPPGKATSGLHVQVLTFSPKALRVRAILLDGSVFDDFSRKPRNREPQQPKKPASGK